MALALPLPSARGAGALVDLGAPAVHMPYSEAYALSADGAVVVGTARFDSFVRAPTRSFRWTATSGIVDLDPRAGISSSAHAVNQDGSVVVGGTANWTLFAPRRAYRWTQADGVLELGTLNGGTTSVAYGVNADGSVVVGVSADGAAQNVERAFRWTATGGMSSLGTLNGAFSSIAYGVNADGSVVVGSASFGNESDTRPSQAFRWTQAGGMVSLGTLNGGNYGAAYAVNADGSVVVGGVADGAAANDLRAFRWTRSTGIVSLGVLNGGGYSEALGVNADGTVVVGQATDGAAQGRGRAFRWTQATGMVTVEDWLRRGGVSVDQRLSLASANGVSADGSVVVGAMRTGDDSTHAYLARVSPLGTGLIEIDQYYRTLAMATPQRTALDRATLVLHGAHNNPLLGLVPLGRSCAWATGDAGHDDYDGQSARLGIAEVGACHRPAAGLQVSGALGVATSRQNLPYNGSVQQNGGYALLEAMASVFRPDLWVTATGYYGWGEAQINRGYLNADIPVTSRGSANVPTWAVRGRVDWQDALRLGGAGLTPYGDLSYMRANVSSYTETDGGFPARYDARSESATQLRYGINVIKPLPEGVRLLGTLEGVHQFNDAGANTTGQVVGLFSFDLPGPQYKQNWARIGIGADAKLGGGTASLMLNATTQGQDVGYWLGASYRVVF